MPELAHPTNIICVIGTRAQLIKMAPILVELEKHNTPYHLILTGQHEVTMQDLLSEFGIQQQPISLYKDAEITRVSSMLMWTPMTIWRLYRLLTKLRFEATLNNQIVLVHGDTMSTLIGAVAGRLAKLRVAHIESGLRSFHLLDPFPEELTRLCVFRLAHIGYCPGKWACSNLQNYRMEIIDTEQNTLLDAVRFAMVQTQLPLLHAQAFGIVSLHRFENIFREQRLTQLVNILLELANHWHLIFVLHPATQKRLQASNLIAPLQSHNNIQLVPRMTYVQFLQHLGNASFVVTDGGSNQEELSYLGIPTALMRNNTERNEGLNRNIQIADWTAESLIQYIKENTAQRGDVAQIPSEQPSLQIVQDLLHRVT